ncbi:MAG: hypothetical protein CVU05_03670 [Bacteroidetes bacterium HGW-Bacteroidetes-21]|nr:MAG: hypothetical protein CVU05_03670 [Bacteroidetes bacterium HGW-Bacteroidetes-21]
MLISPQKRNSLLANVRFAIHGNNPATKIYRITIANILYIWRVNRRTAVMEELFLTYSELKNTIDKMYRLIRSIVGNSERLNLKVAMYQDLEIIGMDWDNFLEEYEKEFNCRLEGLNYNDYFAEEVTERGILLIPLRILTLPALLLPNNSNIYKKIKGIFIDNSKLRLTVGDLVISAIAKKFVKRENVKIIIKYYP